MALDKPGVRVEVTAPRAIRSNRPCAFDNVVGWAVKSQQLDRWTNPSALTDDDATPLAEVIAADEACVVMVGGEHELPLTGALADVEAGDKLWIDPDDDSVLASDAGNAIPLGVVVDVDTARTPDVAMVNTNIWQAFA